MKKRLGCETKLSKTQKKGERNTERRDRRAVIGRAYARKARSGTVTILNIKTNRQTAGFSA